MILNHANRKLAKRFFDEITEIGIDFKLGDRVTERHLTAEEGKALITALPLEGAPTQAVLDEFVDTILPYCTNFSSKNFMGFPDSGNSVAAIGGSMLCNFLQQNLINQSFCAPSATFVEIAVLQWLREVVGYNNQEVEDVWDVGGIITTGGTLSNTLGIMLARENRFPGAMENGVVDPDKCRLIVPKDIGHYSVKSAQMWLGCGSRLIEVETDNFKYNLKDLRDKLEENKDKVMCVVAYAGDSRTMTVDNFSEIARIVRSIDKNIWLHADACHGFSLGFSQELKGKLKGIEEFDSITLDPHKVMMTPYTISALLVKDPSKFKSITSLSDLIMQEPFAFGQITPLLGSRSWDSLKLWFAMKNLGRSGLNDLINKRHASASYLANKLRDDPDFILLNEVEINAVAFMYKKGIAITDLEKLNSINRYMHELIIKEGLYHLHQFSIPDAGRIKKGSIVYPHRFMSGNPNTTEKEIDAMLEYVRELGDRVVTKTIND